MVIECVSGKIFFLKYNLYINILISDTINKIIKNNIIPSIYFSFLNKYTSGTSVSLHVLFIVLLLFSNEYTVDINNKNFKYLNFNIYYLKNQFKYY